MNLGHKRPDLFTNFTHGFRFYSFNIYNGSPKIDTFLKISRNFWNPKKFPTGPSNWAPVGAQNQTATNFGDQKNTHSVQDPRNPLETNFETFFFNEILLNEVVSTQFLVIKFNEIENFVSFLFHLFEIFKWFLIIE